MMDEPEVDRREAIASLGVLGALAAMLVVTIFYRIINPAPTTQGSLEGLTIAAEPSEAMAPMTAQPPGLSGEAPIQHDGEVSAATFGRESSTTGAVPPVGPTFVAPTAR